MKKARSETVRRSFRLLLLCLGALLLGGAAAQLPPEAQEALNRATVLASRAQTTYQNTVNNIDQPLWREAIQAGEEARGLAPDAPEPLRFLAQSYAAVGWDIRAWDFWLRYLDAGGALNAGVREGLGAVGNRLGYARYSAGDFEGALGYYEAVNARAPEDREAALWLGRIFFELGRPEEALPYWQRLVETSPDDEGARYYLERTQQQLSVGVGASNAFQQGITFYEGGRLEEALTRFREAFRANPDFTEALVWTGRTALELGLSEEAKAAWEEVLTKNPDDARARYFLSVAEDQLTWGAEAAQAFEAGLGQYNAGAFAAAADLFAEALEANPDYKDAAVWAARAFQESEQAQRAVAYWQRAQALDPDDTRIPYFLGLARDQARFGAAAASAFSQGLSSYQLADYAEAEAGFRRATEANPDYADAWGWLGRVYFDRAEYARAADAYGRALELEPDDDSYIFFAEEAARLAAEARGGG